MSIFTHIFFVSMKTIGRITRASRLDTVRYRVIGVEITYRTNRTTLQSHRRIKSGYHHCFGNWELFSVHRTGRFIESTDMLRVVRRFDNGTLRPKLNSNERRGGELSYPKRPKEPSP